MFYRENGQFKTSYRADQQIFPIAQDRSRCSRCGVRLRRRALRRQRLPVRAILIPFVIMSLAALGLNILVGYCGQISLGGAPSWRWAPTGLQLRMRVPGMPLLLALLLGGVCATLFGVVFGLPSLRIKGLYLAVATLAAQFFADWLFLRIKWFTNNASGSVAVQPLGAGHPLDRARPNTSSAWRCWRCWRWPPRTWCAAPSAASGWPSATWTWPPR
jgi:branched-chain amino acid transport system permease protein